MTAKTDYIITIGRSYGAGGRSIGKAVAERLGIPYYDSELLEKAACDSGLSAKFLESMDEKPISVGMIYRSVGFLSPAYSSVAIQAVRAQTEILEKVADEGACVIIGRAADKVLAERKLLRVFISAGTESRIRHIMERDSMNRDAAAKKLAKVDRERASYYNQRSDTKWGAADGYDLCINTDWFGFDAAVEMIVNAVR